MLVNEFLKQYGNFLIDCGFTQNSVDQYKSYLRNVGKKLLSVANNLDMIASTEDTTIQGIYVEQMNIAVTNALRDEDCTVDRKKLHDYRCARAVLHAFVENLAWDKGNGAILKPGVSGLSEYEYKDIKKVFLLRVKTQDRLSYPYGVFAARILNKIAAHHKVKIFDKMIDNVKFLIAPDSNKYVYLKNINKLIITDGGHVCIESEGKTYYVYTEVVKNGVTEGYEKIVVSSLGDLSLDHDTPLYHALEAAITNMPEYKKLSDSVKAHVVANLEENAFNISKDYFDNQYPVEKENINESVLLDEMGAFLGNTAMTIMHKSYNSSKNKNNP